MEDHSTTKTYMTVGAQLPNVGHYLPFNLLQKTEIIRARGIMTTFDFPRFISF